jgi:hypothetical protein
MERLKFLSPDGRRLWKFEGMGRTGAEVKNCSRALAEAGFTPEGEDEGGGFTTYELLGGAPLRKRQMDERLVQQIAGYCAFRSSEFQVPSTCPDPLSEMLTFNVQAEFGIDLRLQGEELSSPRLVLADGRMQPHEWVSARDGRVLKTDAFMHGNDHFFPGPCDIAWDLAGAAVEWDLQEGAVEQLLAQYQKMTGDNLSRRLPAYRLAYLVFRMSWCKMAMPSVKGTAEEPRIRQAYLHYRTLAEHDMFLRQSSIRGVKLEFPARVPLIAS